MNGIQQLPIGGGISFYLSIILSGRGLKLAEDFS
jgi:hypothetical protein